MTLASNSRADGAGESEALSQGGLEHRKARAFGVARLHPRRLHPNACVPPRTRNKRKTNSRSLGEAYREGTARGIPSIAWGAVVHPVVRHSLRPRKCC